MKDSCADLMQDGEQLGATGIHSSTSNIFFRESMAITCTLYVSVRKHEHLCYTWATEIPRPLGVSYSTSCTTKHTMVASSMKQFQASGVTRTGSAGITRGCSFFFIFTRFVQFIKKRLNKSPTRHRRRNNASNYEQKLRSTPQHTQHTQHTPILKTPHTTRHPHSLQTYYLPPGRNQVRMA